MKKIIEEHIINGRLGEAIELSLIATRDHHERLHQDFIIQSAKHHNNEKERLDGIIDDRDYRTEKARITRAMNHLVPKIDDDLTLSNFPNIPKRLLADIPKHLLNADSKYTNSGTNKNGLKDVFISYSHWNTEVAHRLKDSLEAAGVSIIIDENALHPGYDVTGFIKDAVKKSRYTISLVSEKSLLSAWVTTETINTFKNEDFNNVSAFLPCYIDKSFLERGFLRKAIKFVNNELDEIDLEIKELQAEKVDTRNLNDEKTRLLQLRNNIDEILRRIRNTKTVNLTETNFDKGVEQLVKLIKG